MAGRPGFFGGARQTDSTEFDPDLVIGPGGLIGASPMIRLGDPNGGRQDGGFDTPPGFDPVWGSLGSPVGPAGNDWLIGASEVPTGTTQEVEVFGDGFEVSGGIATGQFDRLSDWLNMKSGFVQVQDAWHVHLGQTRAPAQDDRKGTLWVRLNQVILVAEKIPARQSRPGAPVVQKQRTQVSIVTPGYIIKGTIHLVAYGSISQFLETPDPHFLPITDITVRWLSDPAVVGRYPFAMINREQIVTVIDDSTSPAGSATSDDEDSEQLRRSGAA